MNFFRQKRVIEKNILAGYLVFEIFGSLKLFKSSFLVQLDGLEVITREVRKF